MAPVPSHVRRARFAKVFQTLFLIAGGGFALYRIAEPFLRVK